MFLSHAVSCMRILLETECGGSNLCALFVDNHVCSITKWELNENRVLNRRKLL